MGKLTLKQFLDLYNFRNYRPDLDLDSNKYDTAIIRIYLTTDIGSSSRYVEFGIYDYSEDAYKEEIYREFINKETLEREIATMCFDEDLGTFCITLQGSDDNVK